MVASRIGDLAMGLGNGHRPERRNVLDTVDFVSGRASTVSPVAPRSTRGTRQAQADLKAVEQWLTVNMNMPQVRSRRGDPARTIATPAAGAGGGAAGDRLAPGAARPQVMTPGRIRRGRRTRSDGARGAAGEAVVARVGGRARARCLRRPRTSRARGGIVQSQFNQAAAALSGCCGRRLGPQAREAHARKPARGGRIGPPAPARAPRGRRGNLVGRYGSSRRQAGPAAA